MRFQLFLIFFIFCNIWGASAKAQDLGSAQKLIESIPQSQYKSALQAYADIIGLSKYSDKKLVKEENYGILDYFINQLKTDFRFQKKTEQFYREINTLESQVAPYRKKNSPVHPNLNETLWTHNPRLPPGLVFQKALAIAEGDARLALKIIAVCGHDNLVSQHQEFSFCPPEDSFFYYPQGLAAAADISNELKTAIARIQAPKKGATVLPAKAYHVYAAAFLTCELISNQMNRYFAENLQIYAAQTYREIRILSEKKQQQVLFEQLKQVPIAKKMFAEKKTLHEVLSEVLKLKPSYHGDQSLEFYQKVPFRFHKFDQSYEREFNQEVERLSLKMLAYLSYESPIFCQKLGSAAECFQVEKVHRQWAIDELWTKEQHRAGAVFARQVCD